MQTPQSIAQGRLLSAQDRLDLPRSLIACAALLMPCITLAQICKKRRCWNLEMVELHHESFHLDLGLNALKTLGRLATINRQEDDRMSLLGRGIQKCLSDGERSLSAMKITLSQKMESRPTS